MAFRRRVTESHAIALQKKPGELELHVCIECSLGGSVLNQPLYAPQHPQRVLPAVFLRLFPHSLTLVRWYTSPNVTRKKLSAGHTALLDRQPRVALAGQCRQHRRQTTGWRGRRRRRRARRPDGKRNSHSTCVIWRVCKGWSLCVVPGRGGGGRSLSQTEE